MRRDGAVALLLRNSHFWKWSAGIALLVAVGIGFVAQRSRARHQQLENCATRAELENGGYERDFTLCLMNRYDWSGPEAQLATQAHIAHLDSLAAEASAARRQGDSVQFVQWWRETMAREPDECVMRNRALISRDTRTPAAAARSALDELLDSSAIGRLRRGTSMHYTADSACLALLARHVAP